MKSNEDKTEVSVANSQKEEGKSSMKSKSDKTSDKPKKSVKKKESLVEAPKEEVAVKEDVAEPSAVPEAEVAAAVKGKSDEEFSMEEAPEIWVPKTALGEKVYRDEITSMRDIMRLGVPIREVGIVNKLLPGLKEEVIDVGRVQRVTDSGRRMRFRVVAVVGNEDGYIGIGEGKNKEVGPAIRQAIDQAKLRVKEIKRGCGSWECGCGTPHTVPAKISGSAGSVKVAILPAPKGVGLGSGEIAKKILLMAGIKDAWVKTSGHTRTGINFAHAVYNALVNTNSLKVSDKQAERLKIISGSKDN